MDDACLLLIARTDDAVIETLRQQAPHRLVHARIADLSRAGWRYESGRPEQATACADGRVIPAEDIAAVVCRIPFVVPSDLPHVDREDRAYVAAEIKAFLRAWLTQFTGVRFNEPTWVSLAGPGWHPLQWTWFVARIGVPVAATSASLSSSGLSPSLRAVLPPGRETVTTTVVGDEVFGATDPMLIDYSLRIARAVPSELLAVSFVRDPDWKFLSAHPCPQLESASASALVERAFAPAFARASSPSITRYGGALCDVA